MCGVCGAAFSIGVFWLYIPMSKIISKSYRFILFIPSIIYSLTNAFNQHSLDLSAEGLNPIYGSTISLPSVCVYVVRTPNWEISS